MPQKEKLKSPTVLSEKSNLKNNRMISVHFQGKLFNITVIQVYAPPLMLKELKLNGSMKTNKNI